MIARRHVAAIADLDPEEAASLGSVLRAASVALRETVGCEKTYVMQFAEAEAHRHVHFHVVPRMPGLDVDRRGPNVFAYLNVPEHEQVPAADRNALAARIGAVLARVR